MWEILTAATESSSDPSGGVVQKLYPTLHEASEEKFVDVANSILKRKNIATKLQTVRKAVGLSQKELSEKSGVTLRMIQQYEQRAKDINKASAGNLFALARVLGCKAEDLLEWFCDKCMNTV